MNIPDNSQNLLYTVKIALTNAGIDAKVYRSRNGSVEVNVDHADPSVAVRARDLFWGVYDNVHVIDTYDGDDSLPQQTPQIQPIFNAIQCELDPSVPVVYEAVSADEHELHELIPATDMDSLVDEMASARLSEAIRNKDMATIKEMLGDDLTLRKMVNPAFQVLSDVERKMIRQVKMQAEEACRANLVDAIHRQDQELIDHYTAQLLEVSR